MFGLALYRHLLSRRPIRRCPQPNFPTRARRVSRVPPVSIPAKVASGNRLSPCTRPAAATWPGPRLCHSDPARDTQGFSLGAVTQAPKPAIYLGFSGLVPFLAAPLAMAATQSFYPEVAHAQLVYGASIVSFLGGARWGFAIPDGSPARPDWTNLGNSVVPSLLAWLALLCRDNVVEGVLVVLMGLGLSLHYDLTLLPGYPAWFKAMRSVLTLVATFSLVATLMLKKFCMEKKLKSSP